MTALERLIWTRAMIILALALGRPTARVVEDFVHGVTPQNYRSTPDYPL